MKNYRMNAIMGGGLYFMGTVLGILGTGLGGEVLTSIVMNNPPDGLTLIYHFSKEVDAIRLGTFFFLLMGISLTGMTVFLFPVIRKVSEELALGFILFRGALEGACYLLSTVMLLSLATYGDFAALTSSGGMQDYSNILLRFSGFMFSIQKIMSPILTIVFLIGAICLYVAFYKSKLIPRWLSIWGLLGILPYALYAVLAYFKVNHDYGVYLQMILAPQEIVMGLWLVFKGFDVKYMKIEE